jgi:hypothetical protein
MRGSSQSPTRRLSSAIIRPRQQGQRRNPSFCGSWLSYSTTRSRQARVRVEVPEAAKRSCTSPISCWFPPKAASAGGRQGADERVELHASGLRAGSTGSTRIACRYYMLIMASDPLYQWDQERQSLPPLRFRRQPQIPDDARLLGEALGRAGRRTSGRGIYWPTGDGRGEKAFLRCHRIITNRKMSLGGFRGVHKLLFIKLWEDRSSR